MDNLSRCMILCEKEGFGVRYGAWRATKGDAPVFETEAVIPKGWRACEYCGRLYKPYNKRPQKYCEAECQNRASLMRQRKRRMSTV